MPRHTKHSATLKTYSFFEDVWEVVKLIPPGKVTTYGAIATYLGSAISSRMVGWALHASITAQQTIPAHRVVNRRGELSGKAHFATPQQMQQLLENEGVYIENDRVKNFETIFWNPSAKLKL